jgi:hypothetical protein
MPRQRSVAKGGPPPPPQYTPPKVSDDTPHPDVTNRVRPGDQKTAVRIAAAGERDPIPFLFGTKETSGGIRYARKVGRDLYIVRILALGQRSATVRGGESAGQLDSLVSLKTEDGRSAASLASHFRYVWYPGALTQGVDDMLQRAYSGWNENLVLTNSYTGEQRGISYVVEKYANYEGWWKENGGLPRWIYRLRGSRLLNPRTGAIAYSENLFEQMRYWVLDPDGLYLWLASLNAPALEAAMDVADQVLGAGKRYRTHFLMEAGTAQDWLKMFRLLGDAFWFEDDEGKWTVLVDRPSAAVASYSDLHYTSVRDIDGAPPKDISQIINKVTIEHTDTSTDPWQTKSVTKIGDGLAAGIEDEVPATYKLLEIHDPPMIEAKLNYLLYGDQDDFRITLPWRANTLERAVGDVVHQTVPERGLDANWRLMWRDKQADGTADVELQLMTTRKYSDVGGPAGPVLVPSILPDRFAAPADVPAIFPSLRAGVYALTWQAVPGRAVGYEVRAGQTTESFDQMTTVVYRGDGLGCSYKPPFGVWKIAIKAYTPTTYSAGAAEVTLTVEPKGPVIGEVDVTLHMYTLVMLPTDRLRIGDYLVVDGLNSREQIVIQLDNSRTIGELDAAILAGAYASIDAWEAGDPEAMCVWGPLPADGCSGEFIDSASYSDGTAYRNQRVKFGMAVPERIGVVDSDANPHIDPLLKGTAGPATSGPTVEFGKGGWANRFGARLATNHAKAQLIIRHTPGQALWQYTVQRLTVDLEQPILTTNGSGVASHTLVSPLGPYEEPEITLTPLHPTPVFAVLTAVSNTGFTIKVVDSAGAAVGGVTIRCDVKDKGKGGTVEFVSV